MKEKLVFDHKSGTFFVYREDQTQPSCAIIDCYFLRNKKKFKTIKLPDCYSYDSAVEGFRVQIPFVFIKLDWLDEESKEKI